MSTFFRITMDGTQENPAVASTATGLGYAIFDTASTSLSYSLNVYGLDFGSLFDGGVQQTPSVADDVTDMHIHNAVRGKNGGVVFAFLNQDSDDFSQIKHPDGSRGVSGVWEPTDPASTSIKNFAAQLDTATIGSDVALYANVHTKAFPGGEIRGQLVALANDAANTIEGTNKSEYINGLAGDDIIKASGNLDFIDGGFGDDTLHVNDAGDLAFDGTGQGSADRVVASTSYVLFAASEIELFNTDNAGGTAAINLTGNTFAQAITGNAGANTLDDGGGAGKDKLTGLGGNDTYFVRNAGTTIFEAAGGGTADIVRAAVTFTLAGDDNIEKLTTTSGGGTAAINLTGNALAQEISGNAGANRIDGRGGNDILTGLGGKDVFVFSSTPGNSHADHITDFSVADDQIELNDAVFTALSTGPLAASAFKNLALGPKDADDRIIYSEASGRLYYDADGSGTAFDNVFFAVLDNKATLTAADFSVF